MIRALIVAAVIAAAVFAVQRGQEFRASLAPPPPGPALPSSVAEPPVAWEPVLPKGQYRALFGGPPSRSGTPAAPSVLLPPPPLPPAASLAPQKPPAPQPRATAAELPNELRAGGLVIRVRGVFATESSVAAVLDVFEGSRGSPRAALVRPGDSVGPYRVKAVGKTSVTFQSEDGVERVMAMFKGERVP